MTDIPLLPPAVTGRSRGYCNIFGHNWGRTWYLLRHGIDSDPYKHNLHDNKDWGTTYRICHRCYTYEYHFKMAEARSEGYQGIAKMYAKAYGVTAVRNRRSVDQG